LFSLAPRGDILISLSLGNFAMTRRAGSLGFVLFTIYLLLYGGFVLLNAFSPHTMDQTPLAGVNLAIWYGFGLIAAALVLALIYVWFGAAPPDAPPTKEPRP
jgi:uncharacterized membrane protein (DUF485 family)